MHPSTRTIFTVSRSDTIYMFESTSMMVSYLCRAVIVGPDVAVRWRSFWRG